MTSNTSNNATVTAHGVLGQLKERVQLAAVYLSDDLDRAVIKATNRDLVVPKAKHAQLLISVTWESGNSAGSLLRKLGERLHESYWAIPFKTLIMMHRLMREGNGEAVMGFLGSNAGLLNMSGYHDNSSGGQGMAQAQNIKAYATYLEERVAAYRELKTDYVIAADDATTANRLASMKWKEGLQRELEVLLRQSKCLLTNRFYLDSVDNDITTEALRLLVQDLMRLAQIITSAVINVLQQFFTLEKADAISALEIYKSYVEQSELITEYFDIARRVQNGLGVTIPELKTAPLSLAKSLQEYLRSPDFEQSRRAQLDKMNGVAKGAQSTPSSTANSGLIDVFGHTDPSGATRAKTAAPPQQIQPPAQPQRIQSQQQSAMLVDFFGGAAAPTTTTAVDMFGFPVVSATPSAGQMSAASASTFQRQVSSSSSTAVAYGQTNSSFVTGTSAAAQNTTVALAGAAQPQAFQQRQGQNAVFSVPTNYIAQSQQPFGIAAPSSSAGGLGASPYIYASGAASQSALPSHMQRQPSNVSMNPSVSGNAPVANNPFDFFAQAPAAQQRPIVSQNSALTGNLFGEQQAYGRSSSTTSSPFAGSASLGHSSQTQLPMKAFGNAIGFPGVPATQQHPQQPLFGGQPQQPNARMPTNNANPFA